MMVRRKGEARFCKNIIPLRRVAALKKGLRRNTRLVTYQYKSNQPFAFKVV